MTEKYGNPSSLHSKGIEAQHELEAARKACADILSADSGEIYFTSGGTESNNTALFGAARALKRRGNRIITTAVEHSSVIEAAAELEKNGFEVIYLEPDKSINLTKPNKNRSICKIVRFLIGSTICGATGSMMVLPVPTIDFKGFSGFFGSMVAGFFPIVNIFFPSPPFTTLSLY